MSVGNNGFSYREEGKMANQKYRIYNASFMGGGYIVQVRKPAGWADLHAARTRNEAYQWLGEYLN